GPGHVADARRLAEKNGKNPNLWDKHVDEYLLKKSNPEFFNDPVCKYGYCRGREPYDYVREILDRYDHYQKFISL
ncbi:MAG: lytic transglycosylase F, partial [Bacteroidetes bacterium]|nr:lytic transglycosylase F [Bacteroidota bacterium]